MDPRIRLILTVIDEQKGPGQLPSIEAGRLLGLSEAYFLRLFHKEVRKTFRMYLREIRMVRAAELLKDHTFPIKQIAFDSGYSDLSNFYRDFKQVHGMSPRQVQVRHLIVQSPESGVVAYSPVSPIGRTNL